MRTTPALVYIAQPVDQIVGHPSGIPGSQIGELLDEVGLSMFMPKSAYLLHPGCGPDTKLAVDTINLAAFAVCDALIAILPANSPTLGVPVEIERALAQSKPTVILCDRSIFERSVQIRSWIHDGASVFPFDSLPTIGQLTELLQPPMPVPLAQRLGLPVDPDLPYTLLRPTATRPRRAYTGDAGLDLAAVEAVKIEPYGEAKIGTGVAFAIPDGYWGQIVGRSSTWHQRGLMVIPSVIDCGWRGELLVSVYNPRNAVVEIDAGDRLAQLVILPAFAGQPVYADTLPPHERGTNGFGSSGR